MTGGLPGSPDGAPDRPSGGGVDVFLLRPEACAPDDRGELLAWLHPSELARHERFVFDRHRVEFLATRALVRRALSSFRPIEPPAWQFRISPHGRPEIDPPCGIAFNLANHPTLIVCAIRTGGPGPGPVAEVGVDVEPLARGPEIVPLADSVFSLAERSALRALPAAAQPDRALALWTLKEAYIKARGLGLSLPLDGFSFALESEPPTISFAPSVPDAPERWTFRTFDVLDHRVALALEVAGSPCAIRVHHVTRLSATTFDTELLDF